MISVAARTSARLTAIAVSARSFCAIASARAAAPRSFVGLATPRLKISGSKLLADTAIAVKRAEVACKHRNSCGPTRSSPNARLAVEAQTEIDRENHRRRVIEALDGPVHATSQRESVNAKWLRPNCPPPSDTTDNLTRSRATIASATCPTGPSKLEAQINLRTRYPLHMRLERR